MIKRKLNFSPEGRSQQNPANPSPQLLQFISKNFNKRIPINYLTGISKKYCSSNVLHPNDKIIQKFIQSPGYISTTKITEYLKKPVTYEKGKPLSDDAVRRMYHNNANSQNKLTFEYLMKMGEEVGVPISVKEAKQMVRMYGNRKNYLSVDDCLSMNERRRKKGTSKTPQNKKIK